MPSRRRRIVVRTLIVAASGVLLLAVLAGYVSRVALDSDQFANRASVALKDPAVRTLIADRVTDKVVLRQVGDLIAARPIISAAVAGVVGSQPFNDLFRSGVRSIHASLFDRSDGRLTLRVANVGTFVAASLEQLHPALASAAATTRRVVVVQSNVGEASARVAHVAERVRLLAPLLALLFVVLAAAALAVSRSRATTVRQLGLAAAVVGVVVFVGLAIGRSIVVGRLHDPDAQEAARAVWDAYLGGLRAGAVAVAAVGAVVAAVATALTRPLDVRARARRLAARLTIEPTGTAGRALRGVALVALGALLLLEPGWVLSLVVAALGVVLVYLGAMSLARLVYRPGAGGEAAVPAIPEVAAAEPSEPTPPARSSRTRRAAVVLAAGAVIAVGVVVFGASGELTTPAPAAVGCNGSVSLCDRPLNDVALAATHNSMSVPLPGWFSAEQTLTIPQQLTAGVRGLLIDTYYGDRLPNGRVRTDVSGFDAVRRIEEQGDLGTAAISQATRLRERLGFKGKGERGVYLCHGFCELGATKLSEVLDQLDDFLVANPDEVVVVVNQDAIRPADFVTAVKDAGLDRIAYRGPFTGRFLTLRQMIDRDQRVVFLAEEHAGGAEWYRPAYDHVVQETPYKFSKVADLTDPAKLAASCAENRGPDDAPLFLLNSWTSTDPVPLPSQAARVNAYPALLKRARTCERIRHRIANLVAVNFYRPGGDVSRVVDTLNGVGPR